MNPGRSTVHEPELDRDRLLADARHVRGRPHSVGRLPVDEMGSAARAPAMAGRLGPGGGPGACGRQPDRADLAGVEMVAKAVAAAESEGLVYTAARVSARAWRGAELG